MESRGGPKRDKCCQMEVIEEDCDGVGLEVADEEGDFDGDGRAGSAGRAGAAREL